MTKLRRRDALAVFGSLSASVAAVLGVPVIDSSQGNGDERSALDQPSSRRTDSSSRTPASTHSTDGSARTTDPSTRSNETRSTDESARTPDRTSRLAYPRDIRAQAHASGSPVSAVADLGDWTAANGSLDRTDWPENATAVRLDSPASANRTSVATTFDTPLDVTTTALSVGVELERVDAETLTLRLFAPDEHDQITMKRYCKRREGTVRLDIAPEATIGSPDPTAVRGLSIESYTGDGKPLGLAAGGLRVRDSPRRRRGAVILTFDDGDHTQYDTAKPIMDEFGFVGVVGVIPWLVDRDDRIDRQRLHEMAADGWEMASHPQRTGSPLPSLSKADQRDLVERSKRWFLEAGFDRRAETLIWPFGAFDERTLDLVGDYHRLAFGTGASPAPWAVTEPGWIPRVNGDDPTAVRNAIDAAERFGTVVTVMYHTIGTSRISATGFRKQLRYIDRADVDVILPSALADAQPY